MYGTIGNGLKGKWSMTKRIAVNEAHVTRNGIEGSDERHFATSTHSLRVGTGSHTPTKERGTAEERAVLVQSQEHVETLRQHYNYTSTGSGGEGGMWGENLMVRGLNADNVCIGDTFEVISQGEKTGAELQVSSPRKPCSKTAGQLSARNAKAKEQEELKAFCRRTGLGGWFFRVLVPGGWAPRVSLDPDPYTHWLVSVVHSSLTLVSYSRLVHLLLLEPNHQGQFELATCCD
jgi:MOSC domain-containing protein YiiM